jgi:hypothetical protein
MVASDAVGADRDQRGVEEVKGHKSEVKLQR